MTHRYDVAPSKGIGNGILRDGKFTTWEGGIRVGGLMRWSGGGKIAPNTTSMALVVSIHPRVLTPACATHAHGHACIDVRTNDHARRGGCFSVFKSAQMMLTMTSSLGGGQATYDIFPTILAYAGAFLPTDRVVDGINLMTVLQRGADRKVDRKQMLTPQSSSSGNSGGNDDSAGDGHACLIHYHQACFSVLKKSSSNSNTNKSSSGGSVRGEASPSATSAGNPGSQSWQTCSGKPDSLKTVGNVVTGIAAVRCGAFKAHFFTKDSPGAQPCGAAGKYPEGLHNPPLMFDLTSDPGENTPLDATLPVYKSALVEINAALGKHVATLRPVPNQMLNNFNSEGQSMQYSVCAAPRSQETLPQWPNCTLTPEHWTKPRCERSCSGSGKKQSPGNAHCLCYGKSAKSAFCKNFN